MRTYTIHIKEQLDPYWQDWFDSVQISRQENEGTLLTLLIPDQTALHSTLLKIHNLGLTLISVNPSEEVSDNRNH